MLDKQRLSGATAILLVASITFVSIAFAQEVKMEMSYGYIKTQQNVRLYIKNTGDKMLSDVSIYVNGKIKDTLTARIAPGKTVTYYVFLEEGEHLIEARTPEGAYASLEVTASKAEVKPPEEEIPPEEVPPEEKIPPEEFKPRLFDFIKKNILWIVLGAAIVVFVISLWSVGKEKVVRKR